MWDCVTFDCLPLGHLLLAPPDRLAHQARDVRVRDDHVLFTRTHSLRVPPSGRSRRRTRFVHTIGHDIGRPPPRGSPSNIIEAPLRRFAYLYYQSNGIIL